MAGRAAHRRRVLALAVVAGAGIGVAFGLLDALVDVLLFGQGPVLVNAAHPTTVWVRFASLVISIVGAVIYARLLLAKEDVASASQQYRVLAESARDDIFIVGRDRRVSYMNEQAAEEFGATPDALIGRSVSELFSGADLGRVESDVARAFEGVEVYSEQELGFDGTRKWLSTRLVPLRGPTGVESILGISRDITGARRQIALGAALARVSEVVHARLSVDEILEAVAAESIAAIDADSSMVLTCDDGHWTIRFAEGYPEEVAGTELLPSEAAASELAVATRAPVPVDDALHEDRLDLPTIRRFGIRSLLAIPLITRRGAEAVLLFTRRDRPSSFPPDVVEFAERVGTTVSLAIDNARLYEEQREVADSLQSALLMLPERLPGLEFAHAYHSSSEQARVGGDFYDLFAIEHDRVGITIGDISGHGIDAAVLTSLVKNGMRVEATQEERPPDEVVARANELLLDNSAPEIFATVFFAVLDLVNGDLCYCNAGHTTGCICAGERGGFRTLHANSPLTGAFPGLHYSVSTDKLAPDELLFLYTDGLTEARRDGEFFGEERLCDVLAGLTNAGPADVARDVIAAVMSFTGNRLQDDLAILCLKRAELGAERCPGAAGSARQLPVPC